MASPFFRRLFLPYLLLICALSAFLGFSGTRQLRAAYLRRAEESLRDETRLVALMLTESGPAHSPQWLADEAGKSLARRVTLIAADGTVLADNEAQASTMPNHGDRPEFRAAATDPSGEGSSLRSSATLHRELMYFARRLPPATGGSPVGPQPAFVRLALPLDALDRDVGVLRRALGFAALGALAAAAGISYLLTRRMVAPVLQLTAFADNVAGGATPRRVDLHGRGEMARLATSLNTMADSLSGAIDRAAADKAELLAILTGMSEGVVATDAAHRIVLANAAASDLLGVSFDGATGRPLPDVLPDSRIVRAAEQALAGRQVGRLKVGPLAGRHLDVTVCAFPPVGPPQGVVVVVHDATQSFRYQELRKEFVANVSHELRTPLTAIKGYAETLRDGAMADPVRGPQYLATIEKHVNQLTNLVSDLLELSHLESQQGLPRSVWVDLSSCVRRAVDLLLPIAEKKGQSLEVQIPTDAVPPVRGNPDYLERAVTNLLDNAIKYTPEGGKIRVAVATVLAPEPHVSLQVIDNGLGIPAADIPRIFERFYRVDRSRSREMGGTGLGLSIVKHIVQAYQGTVMAQSAPGRGSTFTVRLPFIPSPMPATIDA